MISFYDTATLPTEEMLDAMRTARLGDDVYHEDPTVNELEARSAEMLHKEAAIFMPSGTMANLTAVMCSTQHGDEVVVEAEAHVMYYETGGMAAVAGVMPLAIEGERGILHAELIEPKLRKPNQHYPRTTLLCVENTHNRAGGTITSPEVMHGLRALCDRWGMRLHVDGARIFNAAVALNMPVSLLAEDADSICFALSKGLSAPVGSVLAGSASFIERARRIRKMLGGSMRQAGVLAAAGIVSLQTGIDRLAEDHQRAQQLAWRLTTVPGLRVNPQEVETNMVLIDSSHSGLRAEQIVADLKAHGIRASARPPYIVRFVTHRLIGEAEVDILVQALTEILAEVSK
ncbi:MAG TPA: GntG family PLP-dependent aldolase [Ktedonobacteraceae bacterium]|nr:GntG family PLP-dependent aldolase [Ktedonobacteraceae bacterium]